MISREVNYFWKKFDFTNGRTYNQVLNEHKYSKDPVASMSNYLRLTFLDQMFLLFHLGDTYFFINELVKTEGTSEAECKLYNEYKNKQKANDRRWGRAVVASVFLPYFYMCFMKRGISWKVVTFYGLMTTLNAFYDAGMYLSFFIHGPKYVRKVLELDQTESFSPL